MKVCTICHRCYDGSSENCINDTHPPLTTVRDGTLSLINGYRIEKQIESRAYGQTYLAQQDESGVSCRVRILKADDDASKAFIEDTKLVATFFHPNVAGVYDAGVLDRGEVFVVTEDLEGRTLREVLDDVGTPELPASIEIIRQVAEALHALHESGLCHGAVRPENIVLTKNTGRGLRAMLRDVDLGGVVQSAIISNKFTIESALDSLRYFAPEQFTPGKIDARTDVYSLGIVFYELLCGSPPFDASTATGLIHLHKNQTPPELKISDYNLRMLVTHALTESLQKQARLRQSSANVFARQLRHIEQLATHTSTPPPAGAIPATRPRTRSVASPAATVVGSGRPINEPAMLRRDENVTVDIPKIIEPRAETTEKVEVSAAPMVKTVDGPVVKAAKADVEPIVLAAADKERPVVEIIQPVSADHVPRRSRLKSLKKKLHAMSSMVETVRQQLQTPPIRSVVEVPSVLSADAPVIPKPVKPKKVELVQPIDDIPTPVEVREVLAQDAGAITHASTSPVVVPAEMPVESARAIETPVLKSVPEPVLPKQPVARVVDGTSPMAEVPMAQPKPAAAVIAAKDDKRKPAEPPLIAPEKTATPGPIPVSPKHIAPAPSALVPVMGAMNADRAPKPRTVAPDRRAVPAPRREVATAKTAKKPSEFAITHGLPPGAKPVYPIVIQPDPDEITLVRARPRNRIRVDINKPAPKARATRVSSGVAFSPTILGQRAKEPQPKKVQDEMMFASADPGPARAIPYRALAIGLGCVGLLSVVLFASDSVSNFVQSMVPGDSVTAKATVAEERPSTQSEAPRLETSSPAASTVRFTPAPIKEKAPATKTQTIGDRSSTSVRSEAGRSAKTTTSESLAARQTKSRPEPAKTKQQTKSSASATQKSTLGTRPRIVREPRQE